MCWKGNRSKFIWETKQGGVHMYMEIKINFNLKKENSGDQILYIWKS